MKKKIQKPFEAEAAKKGAVIETKGGRPVRIVCYDRKDNYPIVALVDYGTFEDYNTYSIKGEYLHGNPNTEDLVIVEEVEETKFNVGDWVFMNTYGSQPWLVIKVTPNYYEIKDSSGYIIAKSHHTIDSLFHPWTLKDAKPGDVLVCKNDGHPFIFKGCIDEAHSGYPTAYCGINYNDEFVSVTSHNWWTAFSVRPATYEERQLLFNKLEKEGYKWDAKTLTLWKKM